MKPLWRIVDANVNRVCEGLRVCEDLTRFVGNHARITKQLKILRHRINRVSGELAGTHANLVRHRNSAHDVGKASRFAARSKLRIADLLQANFKRAEEGLRVLEECTKILAPARSKQFQAFRFLVYELEKQVITHI